MRIKQTQVFTFNELSDAAKERARDWYREASAGDDDSFETVKEDAEQIGLKVEYLDRHRDCKGSFVADAVECAHNIEKNHGPDCETYKTAVAFLKERDAIVDGAEKDENGDFVDEYELNEKLDECEAEFLRSILEDYAIMQEREQEYRSSDEQVDEMLIANKYEFTADGKRA